MEQFPNECAGLTRKTARCSSSQIISIFFNLWIHLKMYSRRSRRSCCVYRVDILNWQVVWQTIFSGGNFQICVIFSERLGARRIIAKQVDGGTWRRSSTCYWCFNEINLLPILAKERHRWSALRFFSKRAVMACRRTSVGRSNCAQWRSMREREPTPCGIDV